MTRLKPKNLVIRAGKTAHLQLLETGFDPDLFSTLVGASGGPKWLVLSQLDRVLVERFVRPRSRPLDVIGSSIGSFRHACLAQSDPHEAIERFEQAYIGQVYERRPTAREVSVESERILDVLLGEKGVGEVVHHPAIRSHIIAARLNARLARRRMGLPFALGIAALGNLGTRRSLGWLFDRAHFVSGNSEPEIHFADHKTHIITLNERNLAPAILASGSIPFVMEGVDSIDGAPDGRYLDGGLIDYHFDFEFKTRPGLILYPHFFSHIIPGWLDKNLPWRRVSGEVLDRVVLIAPSDEFVRRLPGGRVPDRSDFETQSTDERLRNWWAIVDACRALADEFDELIESGDFASAIEPFELSG